MSFRCPSSLSLHSSTLTGYGPRSLALCHCHIIKLVPTHVTNCSHSFTQAFLSHCPLNHHSFQYHSIISLFLWLQPNYIISDHHLITILPSLAHNHPSCVSLYNSYWFITSPVPLEMARHGSFGGSLEDGCTSRFVGKGCWDLGFWL